MCGLNSQMTIFAAASEDPGSSPESEMISVTDLPYCSWTVTSNF